MKNKNLSKEYTVYVEKIGDEFEMRGRIGKKQYGIRVDVEYKEYGIRMVENAFDYVRTFGWKAFEEMDEDHSKFKPGAERHEYDVIDIAP